MLDGLLGLCLLNEVEIASLGKIDASQSWDPLGENSPNKMSFKIIFKTTFQNILALKIIFLDDFQKDVLVLKYSLFLFLNKLLF